MMRRQRLERMWACLAPEGESPEQRLLRGAAAMHAGSPWVPSDVDIQRGRAALFAAFDQSHNRRCRSLPAWRTRCASRSADIQGHRGGSVPGTQLKPRGQKLSDWKLDPVKQWLIRNVMQGTRGIDAWTLYGALSEPLEGLDGRWPGPSRHGGFGRRGGEEGFQGACRVLTRALRPSTSGCATMIPIPFLTCLSQQGRKETFSDARLSSALTPRRATNASIFVQEGEVAAVLC